MAERHSRQVMLPGWGEDGQKRLASARALVIGAGGLGSVVLTQLVGAGVGKVTCFDDDVVTASNLNRQFLFKESDIGLKKASVARTRLAELDSTIELTAYPFRFEAAHAEEFITTHDIILDCTDDPLTRIMLSDAAMIAGRPLVHASLFRFEGHLTVFHRFADGRQFSLRSLFPDYPKNIAADCSREGIAGPVALTLGGMQSMEAAKWLVGLGNPLVGRLHVFDFLTNNMLEVEIPADQGFSLGAPSTWKEFDVHYSKEDSIEFEVVSENPILSKFVLIDVREEYELSGLPTGVHIPMAEVRDKIAEVPADMSLLFICDRGLRSTAVAKMIREESGRKDVYSVKGGFERFHKNSRVEND